MEPPVVDTGAKLSSQRVTLNKNGKPRKAFEWTEKKREQFRICNEKLKTKREQQIEKRVQELLEQHKERERKEQTDREAQEEINKQGQLDSSKLAVAAEPCLPSTHLPNVSIKMEAKEEVQEVAANTVTHMAAPNAQVREVNIREIKSDAMNAPAQQEMPRQRNVMWAQMENAKEEDVDDVATALQILRAPAPAAEQHLPVYPPRSRPTPLRGTGAGNHEPFEGQPGWHEPQYVPPTPSQRIYRPAPVATHQSPQGLDEDTVRFLASLPAAKATKILAVMMSDDVPQYEPDYQTPVKRPHPVHAADEFMSHARVAQSYHPSRLQQSLHPTHNVHGSQFVWM